MMEKKYARISGGLVAELITTAGDIKTMFHPGLIWVECPSDCKVGWSYVDGLFSPPMVDVGADQVDCWVAIKAERDRRQLEGGVKVGEHWFLSTERATSEYNTIITTTQGLPADTVVRSGWRTMDGAKVDMTPALAMQILQAGIVARCEIDDAAESHRKAMLVSPNPGAYDYSQGWPKIYGE